MNLRLTGASWHRCHLTLGRIAPILSPMKTIFRFAIPLALMLALAAPAMAGVFSTGKYKGPTSQTNKNTHKKRKISFHADATNQQITNMKWVSTGTCSDGGTSIGAQGPLVMDVGAAGKFSLTAKSKLKATTLKVQGSIAGTKASGTFWVKTHFNKKGNPDKNGSIVCSTGTVKWSAKFTG